jgi:hypothetical protein
LNAIIGSGAATRPPGTPRSNRSRQLARNPQAVGSHTGCLHAVIIFCRMGLSRMSHRIETVWEGLRLVVEERPDGAWNLFVYDVENCEVLHTAKRISCEAAKHAAVEFAVAHLYSTDHDLKPEVLSQMLLWEPI